MTPDRDVVAALAGLAEEDVTALLADVREAGRAIARGRLAEAYAEALVRAAARPGRAPAPADASRLRPPAPGVGTEGCYLYAVVLGDGAGVPTGQPGIEPGGPVAAVSLDGLTAVVSQVDVEALRRGCDEADVGERGWLAAAARAHDRIVVEAFRSAPALPLRFGVVHPDRAAVERMLRRHATRIRAELDRLAGRAEWTVKLLADPVAVERQVSEGQQRVAAGPTTGSDGRSFLLRQQAQRDLGARVRAFTDAAVRDLTTALDEVASDLVGLTHAAAAGSPPPAFAAACLVARSDEPRLLALVEALGREHADAGIVVRLDGPWPPFHFTSLRLDGDDA